MYQLKKERKETIKKEISGKKSKEENKIHKTLKRQNKQSARQ